MTAVIVAAPAPIFVDQGQGTPGAPSPTGGVMTVQGQTGTYPVSVLAGVTGPIGPITGNVGVTGAVAGFGSPGAPTGGVLSAQTPDTANNGTLNSLNASVQVSVLGNSGAGIQLSAGTLIGTIIPELSFDGGNTWTATFFDDPASGLISSSVIFTVSNTDTIRTIIGAGGASHVRVRVSAFTSGSAFCRIRASQLKDPSVLFASQAGVSGVLPPTTAQIGGSDGNALRAMRVDTDGTLVITPRDDRDNIGTFAFGGDNRLRIGQESLLFFDTFEGGTINNVLWTQSTSGMTQAQSSSVITLNNTNSTTNGNYSILTSTKSFFLTSEFPIYIQFKARLIPQTNAVIELGFGTAATTAAPTNGCFLRIDSSGNMRAVINFGGTETTSATLGTLTSTNYYSFEIFILEDSIRIDIDNSDGSVFASVVVPIPAAQAAQMTTSHIPAFARVYNSGTPGAAANILISGVSVQQLDLAMVATWEEQMAGTGRGSIADPQTGSQLQNYSNSAAPTTIAVASLSNTTPAYTTLGGLFAFNTPAGAETDYLLFAYQVPDGFTAFIWTIQVGCVILGARSTTSPTVLQWGIAVGSSAASLATGAPNPPLRQTIGFQQAPKTASVGDTLQPPNLTYSPKAPLICFGGKYIQIIVRVVSGNATAGQINRGFINIDGIFQ